jgi:hypothetical protein
MVDLDKPSFAETLTHFALLDGRIKLPLTDSFKRAYWDDLKAMTLADFNHASAQLRRTAKWMPKPSEFWSARRIGWT